MLRKVLLALTLCLVLITGFTSIAYGHDRLDRITNRYRVNHGEDKLRTPDHLHDVARFRSKQLYRLGFFHLFDWINKVSGCGFGENLQYRIPAVSHDASTYVFRRWKESRPHRRIMLGNWDKMASHIYYAPNGGMYSAQLFIKAC